MDVIRASIFPLAAGSLVHLLRLAVVAYSEQPPNPGSQIQAGSSSRRTLQDFGVDRDTGFFPPHGLPQLEEAFALWETGLVEAKELITLKTGSSPDVDDWRARVRSWPTLSIDALMSDTALLQRAHMVLAFLMHFYLHASDTEKVVPRSLAVPLVSVSKLLGIAPVLTFADTVLWNARPADPDFPLSIDNIDFENLFSGTEDEHAFYMASARVELIGVEALRIMEGYMCSEGVPAADAESDLARLAEIVDAISGVMTWVRAHCDPHVFYDRIRPWFCGSDASGPSADGWVLEGVDKRDCELLSGPSAGQSSVMHALDIFLGVDHKLAERRAPAPSPANRRADLGFMERMRLYMPGQHRAFLEELGRLPHPVREMARRDAAVRDAYNAAVMVTKKLRDVHIRIACLYIVTMSKSSAVAACPVMARIAAQSNGGAPARGTGGLEVSLQLKAGRDATLRSVIPDNE